MARIFLVIAILVCLDVAFAQEELLLDTAVLDIEAPAEAKVFLAGKDYGTQRSFHYKKQSPGRKFTVTVEIMLPSGAKLRRTVDLEAGQRTRADFLLVEVDSSTFSLDAELEMDEERTSNRWALLVGVNDYAELEKLHYCSRDMQALAEHLTATGFEKDRVFLLHNQAKETKYLPLKSNVEKQLDIVLGLAEEDDLVVVGFSGHGMFVDGKSYLCPAEARVEDPESTLVSIDLIYEKLQKCPAALKLLIIDACRNDPRPAGQKGAITKADATALGKKFERPPDGILVLASCAPGQISWEDEKLGHGVFMHYLIHGLEGKADANRNGKVSLTELYEYAWLETKTFVGRKRSDFQTPQLFGKIDGVFEFDRPGRQSPAGTSLTNSINMTLVWCPPGKFTMGSPAEEKDHEHDETQTQVAFSSGFWIGKNEVTQEQWKLVMGSEPWKSNSRVKEEANCPACVVNWHDATEFCRRLTDNERRDGHLWGSQEYRLPTEAHWEYACRAGSTTKWSFGEDEAKLGIYAWYDRNADAVDEKYAHVVGQKQPNPWGICDMHGNVWEWCRDSYRQLLPGGTDPLNVDGESHVLRGGCWSFAPRFTRSAARLQGLPEVRYYSCGFRVERTP